VKYARVPFIIKGELAVAFVHESIVVLLVKVVEKGIVVELEPSVYVNELGKLMFILVIFPADPESQLLLIRMVKLVLASSWMLKVVAPVEVRAL